MLCIWLLGTLRCRAAPAEVPFGRGIAYAAWRGIRPTLEDVFVSLTTARARGAESMSLTRLLAVAQRDHLHICVMRAAWDCRHHAHGSDAVVWLWGESRSEGNSRVCLRSGRQSAEPGFAQALSGQRVLSHCCAWCTTTPILRMLSTPARPNGDCDSVGLFTPACARAARFRCRR